MTKPHCRTCGSENLRSLGALPTVNYFAGRTSDVDLPGGSLWRCNACYFLFRHPLLEIAKYEELYRNGDSSVWEPGVIESAREDFRLIRREIDRFVSCHGSPLDILDVGCYTGALLGSLSIPCRSYGIEPNVAAARIARARGINIVGENLDFLSTANRKLSFDLIVVCDVIEHLPEPLHFLAALREHLKPGGRVLVSTGNADFWFWRMAGARYWYCSFPEHISFIGVHWLRAMLGRIGLTTENIERFNYGADLPITRKVRASLGAAVYASSPTLLSMLKNLSVGSGVDLRAVPGCGALRDHMLCTISRLTDY